MIPKPEMITILAHPTNTWKRYDTKFEYIVMHYVGAVSTAINNGNYYGREPNLGASAHFFVDEYNIVSSVPLSLAAGHCGVDYSGGRAPYWNGKGTYSTNRRSIGIEMCCKRKADGTWYIEPATVTRAVGLVRWLMQEFNIPASHVIRHYDVCWKQCPEPWVRDPKQWDSFKRRLTEEDIEVTMSKAELTKLITETVNQTVYGDVKEVPDWWEGDIQQLLDLGVIDGGTDADVNDHDVNITKSEAKVLVIMMRLLRKKGVL